MITLAALRIAVATLLGGSAVLKVWSPYAATLFFWQLGAGWWVAVAAVTAVIAGELAVAIVLLSRSARSVAMPLAWVFVAMAAAHVLLAGVAESCGCFGAVGVPSGVMVALNFAAAGAMTVVAYARRSPPLWCIPRRLGFGLALLGAVVSLAVRVSDASSVRADHAIVMLGRSSCSVCNEVHWDLSRSQRVLYVDAEDRARQHQVWATEPNPDATPQVFVRVAGAGYARAF